MNAENDGAEPKEVVDMENNQEPEIMVFTDEDGNDVNVQVLDYFYYNGDEYAVMVELPEGAEPIGAEDADDENLADIFFMKVVPVDEENVEYEPVEDDELAARLFEIVNGDYGEDDE